jgi:hypothetical protein
VQAHVAAVLGDDLVGGEQVEQQAESRRVGADRAPQRRCVTRAVLDEAIDQAELECRLQSPSIDERAQLFLDRKELERHEP